MRESVDEVNEKNVNYEKEQEKNTVGSLKIMPNRLVRYFFCNRYIFVTALLAILEFGSFPNKQMGFYCNDPKISFKFVGDTISLGLLLSLTFILPIIAMVITEYACYFVEKKYKSVLDHNFRIKQAWNWYCHYIVGIVALAIICEIMKVFIGEPRPHFLDTCRPREAANCTNEYIKFYTCMNTDYSAWFISDSNRSFPSGHAALSVCTSIFIVWYLQNRLPDLTLFLKPWLQCLVSAWAVTCSVTRIGDNRHHWWDVLFGIVLGFVFGLFIVVVSCQSFRASKSNTDNVVVVTHNLNETAENGRIGFTDN